MATGDTAKKGFSRSRRWLIGGAILVLLVVVLSRLLLAGFGWLLIWDDPPTEFNTVLMLGGDRCHEGAAILLRQDPSRKILLIRSAPDNLVKCGALPAGEITARRLLQERGVPPCAILTADGQARSACECARLLQHWMTGHPGGRVLALCDRFDSRRMRLILDHALDGPSSERVAVHGLPDRIYDESNWWRTRRGVKQFLIAALALLYTRIQGPEDVPSEDWDPDEYECQLRRTLNGTSP